MQSPSASPSPIHESPLIHPYFNVSEPTFIEPKLPPTCEINHFIQEHLKPSSNGFNQPNNHENPLISFLFHRLNGPAEYETSRPLASLSDFIDKLYNITSIIKHKHGVGISLFAKSAGFGRKEVVAEVARRLQTDFTAMNQAKSFRFLYIDGTQNNTYSSVIKVLAHQAGINFTEGKSAKRLEGLLLSSKIKPTLLFVDNTDQLIQNGQDSVLYLLTNIYSQNDSGAVAVVFSTNTWNFDSLLEVRIKSRISFFLAQPVPSFDQFFDCFFRRISVDNDDFTYFLHERLGYSLEKREEIVEYYSDDIKDHNISVDLLSKITTFRLKFEKLFNFTNNPMAIFNLFGSLISLKPNINDFNSLIDEYFLNYLDILLSNQHPEVVEMILFLITYAESQSTSSEMFSFSIHLLQRFIKERKDLVDPQWISTRFSTVFDLVINLDIVKCINQKKSSKDSLYVLNYSTNILKNSVSKSQHYSVIKGKFLGID
ncbi:hypothetical protein P9112_011540 [Eukaryota sp. TZLM1-RC]